MRLEHLIIISLSLISRSSSNLKSYQTSEPARQQLFGKLPSMKQSGASTLQVPGVLPMKYLGDSLDKSGTPPARGPNVLSLFIIVFFFMSSIMGIVIGIAGIVILMKRWNLRGESSLRFPDTDLKLVTAKNESIKHPGCTRVLHSVDKASDESTASSSFLGEDV
jgi:hypothetical protein